MGTGWPLAAELDTAGEDFDVRSTAHDAPASCEISPRRTAVTRKAHGQSVAHSFLNLPKDSPAQERCRQQLWLRLTANQRCLLATDGSFSLILSALTNQNIRPVTLSQELVDAQAHHHALDVAPGRQYLRRKVVLRTSETDENLVYAESDICLHRLERSICDQLLEGKDPIGLILRQHRVESFRELIDWGQYPASHGFAQHFNDEKMLSRQYKIIARGRPIMVVTEQFPATSGLLL